MTMFNTLITVRKYSVIASASRSNLPAHANMMRHVDMMNAVKQTVHKKDHEFITPVTGFYREEGAEALPVGQCFEQSVMLGTDSLAKVNELIDMFCGRFNQDCILVQDNDSGAIMLMGDGWSETIGYGWRFYCLGNMTVEEFAEGHNAFTILPTGQVVEVVSKELYFKA